MRDLWGEFPRATADKGAARAEKKISSSFMHIASKAFPPPLHNFRTQFSRNKFPSRQKRFPPYLEEADELRRASIFSRTIIWRDGVTL